MKQENEAFLQENTSLEEVKRGMEGMLENLKLHIGGLNQENETLDIQLRELREDEAVRIQKIENKVIDEGMMPKVNAGIYAIEKGVRKAHIIDAKIPHALLLEIFTNEGIGTEIVA